MSERQHQSRHPIRGDSVERLSISVPKADKAALERIAADKKVSLAWVIRDAVSQYLANADHTPSGN